MIAVTLTVKLAFLTVYSTLAYCTNLINTIGV